MMKIMMSFRRGMMASIAVAAAAVLFTACMKDKEAVDVPAAGLMAFNLAPDQQSVVVTLSGSTVTRLPLGYNNFTGFYQNIYTGTRTVESYDYPQSLPLASVNYNFENDKYYSVFVVGAGDNYRNVVIEDKLDSLPDGSAYIRYINAITDSVTTPNVTITAGGNSIVNENATYAGVSEFKAVTAGEVSIAVANGSTINASRSITLEQNKIYTILLIGVPGATDASKVEIKFIANGQLDGSN